MRVRPYLTLLRRNRAFSSGLVTLTIAASTFLAGLLAEQLPPAFAVWSLVGLAAAAALGWIVFSRPIWRQHPPRDRSPAGAGGD